ncbi:hypothetical protein SERLA73DRAFT_77101 [Serpula lacrymans var. lacrymans S7.3]|uniref:RING-type domain-containing protein n=1 Tax=Serpula lacrymans var. lacrymans (strain S7.3) TaxID=936435 RepID=F8Q936_SERL3|nr:hypothetical protein SERLA73DRAFT_77101 [Serpula lacrymans var. lacrymans S7.3]
MPSSWRTDIGYIPLKLYTRHYTTNTPMNNQEPLNNRRNNFQRRAFIIPADTPASSINAGRRRKSLSPDTRNALRLAMPLKANDTSDALGGAKKKRPAPTVPTSRTSTFPEGATFERGRKGKVKSRPQSRYAVENSNVTQISVSETRHPSKKERSKSRDSSHPQTVKHSTYEIDATDNQSDSQLESNVVIVELRRLRGEVENLRRQAQETKKTIKKQSKVIDELRQEITSNSKDLKESELQVQKWKSKSKKSEEIINNVESNAQCQICMELLCKPFVLSPCGHIFCLECLQEWFRKAPPDDNDMYDDDDDDYHLYRRKTCPCCRKAVRHRPIPVFVIKSIISALSKTKASSPSAESPNRASPIIEGDPWDGLFLPLSEEDDYQDDDDDDEDDDEEDGEDDEDEDDIEWLMDVFSYGSDSGDEPYEGEYVSPDWEPPTVQVDADDYPFSDFDDIDLNVLRRGVTIDMLETYAVEYSHDFGLIAYLQDDNRIFLGWTIKLSADDDTGDVYIQWLLDDMEERPDRWEIIEQDDGTWDAHRLVPAEDVIDHEDTDSDNYIDNDDLD